MVLVAIMYMGPLSLKHGILSTMIPFIMKRQAERFGPERDILLGGIMENDEVLDIGCGGGAYLRHYTKASNIVALEPVVDMHDGIRQVAKQVGIPNKNLTILPLTLEEYVNSMQQSGMQKQQFDWIIVGNVLCEVSNPMVTLQSIKILTKPGGHVYFSEHEGATSGTWARLIQDIINPFWVTISGGCNCNRDILQMVRSSLVDDWELAIWEYPHIQVAMGPSFLGLARKI
jgi:2-polyprenyl-3-methyl-5-hydroxy-6-metoxy-1,4-benzoquinol methylase